MDAIPPGPGWTLLPQGERCLVVAFGERLDPATGRRCLAAAERLRAARLPGVTDVVPSFAAVALHWRPQTGAAGPAELAGRVRAVLADGIPDSPRQGRDVEIPVCYGGAHGPDLDDAARACGLAPDELVALHGAPGAMVFMLGFAPGLPYIGVHDARLGLPRRDTPRTAVAAGSVAIANRQTVIYPARLPGGWHVIGATPLALFDPLRDPPARLEPGDRVRFVPIGEREFAGLREASTGAAARPAQASRAACAGRAAAPATTRHASAPTPAGDAGARR